MAYVGEFTGKLTLFNCAYDSLVVTSYAIKTNQVVRGFEQFDRLLVGVRARRPAAIRATGRRNGK
jgi:hypothetical protein